MLSLVDAKSQVLHTAARFEARRIMNSSLGLLRGPQKAQPTFQTERARAIADLVSLEHAKNPQCDRQESSTKPRASFQV